MLLRKRSVAVLELPTRQQPVQCDLSRRLDAPSRRAVRVRASNAPSTADSNSGQQQQQQQQSKAKPEFTTTEYLSPFSQVDPAMQQTSSPSQKDGSSSPEQQQDPSDSDKWGDVLSVNHTLSSLYIKQFEIEPFKQRDWEAKRRESDLQDVIKAGSKLGAQAEVIQANLQQLQALVPGLLINLDKMKASDWAQLLRNIDSVIQVVIALKTHYPKVDISNLIKRKPKLLMLTQQRVDEDAGKVKGLLSSKVQDIDAIIDAVPDLMNPQQLTQSLQNLVAWFPNHDPFELLQQNPNILENPNVEADPTYGQSFW